MGIAGTVRLGAPLMPLSGLRPNIQAACVRTRSAPTMVRHVNRTGMLNRGLMTLGVVALVSLSGCGGGPAEKADTSRVTSSASATDSASQSASTVDSPTADTAKVTIGAVGYGL